MKQRPGTSKLTYILLLVLLGAALAAGYFLYFRPEPSETAEVTVPTAHRTAQNKKVQTKISGKVKAEKPPEPVPEPPDPAEILAEFSTPFVVTPPQDLITPVLPETLTAKVSQRPTPEKSQPATTPKPVPLPEPAEPSPAKTETASTDVAKPEPKPEPKKEAASKPAPTVAQAPKPSKGGKWVANVLSTRDGEVARTVLDQLMKLPYNVYAYKTVVKGKQYYRIRVGFFNSQSEAEQVGLALAAKYRLPKPWIVRPGPQELKKYQN